MVNIYEKFDVFNLKELDSYNLLLLICTDQCINLQIKKILNDKVYGKNAIDLLVESERANITIGILLSDLVRIASDNKLAEGIFWNMKDASDEVYILRNYITMVCKKIFFCLSSINSRELEEIKGESKRRRYVENNIIDKELFNIYFEMLINICNGNLININKIKDRL